MADDKPMEVEAPEPAEPVAPPPSEEPETTEPEAPKPEAPKPEAPKPKPRKKKATIREDPILQEPATRAKRQNQRTSTPPALLVDQTFWAGLLATEKARKREARQQTLSNFRIFG